jgi:hypothetical protein
MTTTHHYKNHYKYRNYIVKKRLKQKEHQTKRFARGEKMYDRGWQNADPPQIVCPHCGTFFVLTDEMKEAIKFYLSQFS